MALTNYVNATQRLLHDVNAEYYSTADLVIYVNEARTHVAAEGACIRGLITFPTTISLNTYLFINLSVSTIAGASAVLAVRKAALTLGSGSVLRLDGRNWDWFFNYCICAPSTGQPSTWAQLSQGANGQFYLWPTPAAVLTLTLDVNVLPLALTKDGDYEAIPYPWTAAVKYYAAYLAYMNAQRSTDADRMYQLYLQKMTFARDSATPTALPRNFPLSSQLSGVPGSTPSPYPGAKQ